VGISKALVDAHPSDPVPRSALAVSYASSGTAYRADKKPKDAISFLEMAASELEKLCSDFPTNNGYRRNLAGAYTLLGSTWTDLGSQSRAIENFQRSVETVRQMIKVDPADARPRITLALALIRLAPLLLSDGRRDEALRVGKEGLGIFRSFAERPNATPDDWNNYASYLLEIGIPELRSPGGRNTPYALHRP
jgi:tetratricopeptide (TPR) repeat protein